MSILVTGSSGFIGKRFTKLLDNKDISYRTIGRSHKNDIYCDFETDSITNEAFEGIDSIVHIAGYAHDITGKEKNAKHRLLNFRLTETLLKLADKNNLNKFVFISSVKAGGQEQIKGVITEESLKYDNSPYASSKRASENFILNYLPENTIDKIIIRPSLVYGRNMKGNLGLMSRYIEKGIFPPLPNSNNRKAFIHVDDLARSICYLLEKQEINNEIFSVTDGSFYTPRDIYESLSLSLGKTPKKWSIPLNFFKVFAFFPIINKYLKKIIADEPYSSKKIRSLGFEPTLKLKQAHEEIF